MNTALQIAFILKKQQKLLLFHQMQFIKNSVLSNIQLARKDESLQSEPHS